jgi:hypothetical protein
VKLAVILYVKDLQRRPKCSHAGRYSEKLRHGSVKSFVAVYSGTRNMLYQCISLIKINFLLVFEDNME